MFSWLPTIEGGQAEYDTMIHVLWRPTKIAFDLRDTADVLRHFNNYISGFETSEPLPPEIKSSLVDNFAEWKALANSQEAFNNPSEAELKQLSMPVMIITAGKTFKVLELTNPVLVKSMPNANHLHVADGTHDFWMTHPDFLQNRVMEFLRTCK
jgi:pimeloyl-ACP methyl ester carboxylesterase